MNKTLMIIPTYNEIENIERLIAEVLARQTDWAKIEVLVVDDASADGTGDAVRAIGEKDGRVHLIERPQKLGLGTAYIAGFRFALEHNFAYVGTMDADFSHDPEHLPAIIAAISEADLVIGSRYIPGGGIRNWGFHRHVMSATANFLARMVGGIHSHDCTTGYRLYRSDLLRLLELDRITSHGYSCLIELVFVCQRHGARIVESPIIFVDRRAGHSKISKGEIFKAFATLYHLGLRRLRS